MEALRKAAVVVQGYGSAEGNELVHLRHVDAVVVGVTHLRRRTYHHNAARMQAVHDADDALAQRGAAHNAVVDDHEVIHAGAQRTVGNVVDVGSKVVARITFGYESAHLDIFPRHLLRAYAARQDAVQALAVHIAAQGCNLAGLGIVQILIEALQHAVVGCFGRVGYVGENGIVHLGVDSPHNGRKQCAAQFLAFAVNVLVGAAAEVDALKGAGGKLAGGQYLFGTHASVAIHENGLARQEFVHLVGLYVEGGLYDGALRGNHHNFIVLIPEGRTYAPGVAHAEEFARAADAAHHIAAIPHG